MIQMDPLYRKIFLLRLQGMAKREISRELNISAKVLDDFASNESFRKLEKLLGEAMLGDIEYDPVSKSRKAAKDGDLVQMLWDIAKDDNQPATARLRAIEDVMDRGWGKPTEKLQVSEGLREEISQVEDEAEQVLEEIEEATA